ncbi:metal-dependent hydrolase [Marinospirillum perlucidum]|uniref:metal-dependent hydrolase n=1 Tax=Marinospirillum perlucidum TaxID=1982602 RepID=UPI000DF31E84|nr:metal-dependent hydrolase [Marinospirillum perlucidum]
MANFATHLGVAAVAGSSLATGLVVAEQLPLSTGVQLVIFFLAGTLLPDVDVDKSRPVRWLFSSLGLLAVLLAISLVHPEPQSSFLFFNQPSLPGWEVLAAALAAWLVTRYLLAWFFQKFTRHRGLSHSLLIAGLWSLGWIALGQTLLLIDELLLWQQGLALFLGFILHLLLDELYSVDLEGARIKRSFGSAFKLYARDAGKLSLAGLVLLFVFIWLLPWPVSLLEWLTGTSH